MNFINSQKFYFFIYRNSAIYSLFKEKDMEKEFNPKNQFFLDFKIQKTVSCDEKEIYLKVNKT